MKINEAKLYFFNSLKQFYNQNELNSLFKFIFEFILNRNFAYILANPQIEIDKNKLDKIISRLKKYEPYQYIIGNTEFYDSNFKINKNVLIPRPETEELVRLIINDNKNLHQLNILDIGTGSGCIIISIAKNLDYNNCVAIDISDQAIQIAKQNAKNNNVKINFFKNDILQINDDFFKIKFDIIVSNPPYVINSQKTEMNKNVLDFEPQKALFVDDDNPLIFYKRIAEISKNILKPNGKLYFEINELFGNEIVKMLNNYKYREIKLITDFNKKDRFVSAIL